MTAGLNLNNTLKKRQKAKRQKGKRQWKPSLTSRV